MVKLLRFPLYLFILCISLPMDGKAGRAPVLGKSAYAWEEYDSSLFYRFQSINDILSYADSSLGIESRRTLEYCELLADIIRRRFYHGYRYFSMQDNWIAWLTGTLSGTIFTPSLSRETNAPIAPNATLFHKVTNFLSFSLPLMLPLGMLVFWVGQMRAYKDKKPKG